MSKGGGRRQSQAIFPRPSIQLWCHALHGMLAGLHTAFQGHDIASSETASAHGVESGVAISTEDEGVCRDHSVEDGLEYVATWNSAQMPSEDLQSVINGLQSNSKQLPHFSKL